VWPATDFFQPRLGAAAIALGAIVAPPDAVAANEVLRHLRIPQRIGLALQGESMLNDATALWIYRAADLAAAGSFSLVADAPILVLAAVGGVSVQRRFIVVAARPDARFGLDAKGAPLSLCRLGATIVPRARLAPDKSPPAPLAPQSDPRLHAAYAKTPALARSRFCYFPQRRRRPY
jgi:hypothetical protein